MKPTDVKLILICLIGVVLAAGSVCGMTIQLGSAGIEFIAPGDTWKFFRGTDPASDPADAWKETNFDDSGWETGYSGFGYGDGDDATILDDMEGSYVTVYIRKEFSVSSLSCDEIVQLVIDYDDGFIAYLNGREIARRHMPDGPATYETTASSHEAGTPEMIVLGTAGDLLNDGSNLLAIEGHNSSANSTDFSLIPALRTVTGTVRNDDIWIVDTRTVTLRGTTDVPDATSVMIGGIGADFNPGNGTWQGEVSLMPGLNTVTVEALDAQANVVDSGSMEVVYVPAANRISGELSRDTTWSEAIILEETVTVPTGTVLTIQPGVVVLAKDTVALVVHGQLLAEGTESEPIRFTHYGDGTTWKQIMFVEAADSRLARCIIEYADSQGEHQDYYEPGPRTYHEAVVVLASHVDFEGCIFQKLPNESNNAEGDAIAVISDDQDHPGAASANVRNCKFLSIGQGVHTRYAYVLVENCYFQGKRGDNDDIDLWGESTPPCLIRRNLFDVPEHDDRVNPTRCSAIIVENVIRGSDDHGIVLRDKCSPIVMNNVIYNCNSGGIAVENSCTALLVNNTIVNCPRGLRLFDLGRWGPPYSLNPGGGTATVINCIIWDCTQAMTLADSSNTQIADRGSHVTVSYCDIKGGRNSISVSGTHSTVTWGQGNIDADPQFADPGNRDYHLKSQAGRWDPAAQSWIQDALTSPCIDAGDPNSDWTAELWPHGKRINIGAYGGTPQASMSLSAAGNIADLDRNDTVDPNDLAVLADVWLAQDVLLAADLNHDATVDFRDLAKFAANWRADARSEQEPFDISLGSRAAWSQQHKGYDPALPGYHIVGDIASVTIRGRVDNLPEKLILAIRTSPGMPPMLENFTFAAPCVTLTGEPFKGTQWDYSTRDNSSADWQGPSKVGAGTYFNFDVVGDEVHVTFLQKAIDLLRTECRISWIDWYR